MKKWWASRSEGESPYNAQVGEELGQIEYEVTRTVIEEYADIADDHDPWFLKQSPFGGPIAHPTIGANDYSHLLTTKYSSSGVVHVKAAHEFLNPIKPGKTYTVKAKVVDRYTRRGRDYLTVETVTTDEDGLEIVRSRNTWLLSMERKEQK